MAGSPSSSEAESFHEWIEHDPADSPLLFQQDAEYEHVSNG